MLVFKIIFNVCFKVKREVFIKLIVIIVLIEDDCIKVVIIILIKILKILLLVKEVKIFFSFGFVIFCIFVDICFILYRNNFKLLISCNIIFKYIIFFIIFFNYIKFN